MGVLYDTVTHGRIPNIGRITTCRGCGAEIVWIKTPSGKSMPCDATPVYYKIKADGKEKIITPNGVVISCEIISTPYDAAGIGYVPHWSTCTTPDKFRNKKPNKENKK